MSQLIPAESIRRVHEMLELAEHDLPVSFYQVIHPEDAVCLAEAHKEGQSPAAVGQPGLVLKNGSSGLLIYRLISSKSRRTYFVQSSCRMFYKNGKPESIGLTHRLLKYSPLPSLDRVISARWRG